MVALVIPYALGILKWFIESKIGRIVGAVIAAAIALSVYTVWVRHTAQAEIIARELALTKAESARRMKVIADAQAKAREVVTKIGKEDLANADLVTQIDALSAAHDGSDCLGADSVGRLQQLGQPQGERVGPGTRSPAR